MDTAASTPTNFQPNQASRIKAGDTHLRRGSPVISTSLSPRISKKGASSCSDLSSLSTTNYTKGIPSYSSSNSPSLQVRLRKKKTDKEMRPKSMVMMNSNGRRSNSHQDSGCMPLLDALNDKKIKIGFRKFLESEFSVENLDFWLAVQDYKSIKNKQRKTKAEDIYNEYISPGSPSQINLDHYTTQQVVQHMPDLVPSTTLFNAAQKYVFNIMENDSYARFVRSKCFDICHSTGRRSPRKFLQDILYISTRARERSPSPKAKRISGNLMVNNSNNKAVLHKSDSNLDKNCNEEGCYSPLGLNLNRETQLANSDPNLPDSVSESRSIKSFFSRLRAK